MLILLRYSARLFIFALCAFGWSHAANAWWNDAWSYRTPIGIDASVTGANLAETNSDITVLLKLHTGNFEDFFLVKEDLSDLRFVGNDDLTPLKHHVEHFDIINQLMYVWVKIPKISNGINTEKIWMYYGNESAVSSADPAASYDANTALVYHFNSADALPKDATAYGASATQFTGDITQQSVIASGASFKEGSSLVIPDMPSFALGEDQGMTISFWLEPAGVLENAWVFERRDGARSLALGINGNNLFAVFDSGDGEVYRTPDATVITDDSWQHVTLVLSPQRMSLYVDGLEVSFTPISLQPFSGGWVVGNSQDGKHPYRGEIDEFRIDTIARNASWIKTAIATEGVATTLLQPKPSEQLGSGGGDAGMWMVLLTSTGQSGWTVIVLLGVMAALSWAVMLGKFVYIQRVQKENKDFLKDYRKLGSGDPTELDQQDSPEDEQLDDSPITQALFGRHDHFQSSPVYRLYHRGVQEVQARLGSTVGARAAGLKVQTIDAIKASLDAQLIREVQRLNSQMVLLTIAISGGPFLGLLGTVLGVMITFAAIALTGDVNISAIAPGVAAALLTTVAGLVVAIPALFGYNYLATRIKESIADMRVFSDEFITRVAEYYGQ